MLCRTPICKIRGTVQHSLGRGEPFVSRLLRIFDRNTISAQDTSFDMCSSVPQEFAGVGGDVRYGKHTVLGAYHVPLFGDRAVCLHHKRDRVVSVVISVLNIFSHHRVWVCKDSSV